jgi:bifunctional DNA-binding transcriptional regulator/antitoxin component of YhaV-PrlF toxin-antitoxin module
VSAYRKDRELDDERMARWPYDSDAAMLHSMGDGRTFVALQGRGLIALPADLRRRAGLDQPGAQVEIVERPDGVIELHPTIAVPADQAWFWTDRWQAMEREVDEQIARGEGTVHDSIEEMLAYLDRK